MRITDDLLVERKKKKTRTEDGKRVRFEWPFSRDDKLSAITSLKSLWAIDHLRGLSFCKLLNQTTEKKQQQNEATVQS